MVKEPKAGERYYHACDRPIETMKGWGVVSEAGPVRSLFVFEATGMRNSVENRCLYLAEEEARQSA